MPELEGIVWLLEEVALEMDEEGDGERLIDFRAFVGQHNWPDPALITRFAWALDWLAVRRVKLAAEQGRWPQ